jgi:hypothetical protein
MKKVLSVILSVLLCLAMCVPAFATDDLALGAAGIVGGDEASEAGFTVEEELIVYGNTRSTSKTASKVQTIKSGGTTVATITLTGTFSYTGSSVSVVSKSVTKTLADGWSYTQSSLTTSGGTITLKGSVSKLLLKYNFTVTLTCDKNGNIS